MKPINVLSAFDGISCGQVALERAGIKVNNYYASEIDKYCIEVTKKNYPNTIQLGDVRNIKGNNLSKIDLLIAGSPCQGFSFAGKQLNFNDPRSKLFFEFVRLLNECKPKYFLLENVRMKKEYQDIISKYLKVEPIMINSALVSAQNRKRLFWTNIPNIIIPKDKHIYLKDILEKKVDEKYYMKENWISWWNKNKDYQLKKKYSSLNSKKAITMTARQYVSWNGNFILCIAQRGRYNKDGSISQKLEPRFDGKSNSLTTVQKDNQILELNKPNKIGELGNGGQGERIYSSYSKSVTLSALGGGRGAKTGLYSNNGIIRKLTPIECERLQTIPDNYTEGISDSQRYKALGNGWTVDIIVHIIKGIK